MNNANSPANPCEIAPSSGAIAQARSCGANVPVTRTHLGLTKREMMAMHFHAALLSAHNEGEWSGVGADAAEWAVKEADALLAELERTCLKP